MATWDVLLDLTTLDTPSRYRGLGRAASGLAQGMRELSKDERLGLRIAALTSNIDSTAIDETISYAGNPALKPDGKLFGKYKRERRWRFAKTFGDTHAKLVHVLEPVGTPLTGNVPRILTAYDLIPLIFHREYLGRLPFAKEIRKIQERRRYLPPLRLCAISEATKRDVVELLNVDPARVDVTYLGVDHDIFTNTPGADDANIVKAAIGVSGPFVLYVGAYDARKNVSTLVEAYAASGRKNDLPLVLVGKMDKGQRRKLDALARKLKVQDHVKFAGYVADAHVPALYRQATVHAFPTLYEGFGLPALEAMACGAPTLTTRGGSVPEVVGDAAVMVDARNAEEMANALRNLVDDSSARERLRREGPVQAKKFTWRACAQATVQTYRRAVDELG